MPNIKDLVERVVHYCVNGNVGYDMNQRYNLYNGGETDCSWLICGSAQQVGFNIGKASTTFNMAQELTQHGWVKVPNDGKPQYGDILLNIKHHTALYIGNGQVAQASIDERGKGTGGQTGNQTGYETNIKAYYNYPWDCYLRYTGTNNNNTATTETGFLMALSEYDQQLTKNAVVDINNRTDRMEKALTNLANRLGPISEQFPFDYLPAILNNLNSLFAVIGKQTATTMTDDQITALAQSLKEGLGEEVIQTLVDRLNK